VTSDPLIDTVSGHYQRWMYPEPIFDLPAWLETDWQWFDPSHSHRMFWPQREEVSELDILVAGCGTNQGAVLAYTNPSARVVAIDVSEPGLNHHEQLKRKYGLENLELVLLPIEDVKSLSRDFDLIVSTGVLHHMAEPVAGMTVLANCLRADGVAAIMLYARNGRSGLEMLQGAFREVGLSDDQASVEMVKEALSLLPHDHPIQSYLENAPDLQFDAGLVDTFLHVRERSYTVDECRALVASSGLAFNDWFLKRPYYPPVSAGSAFESSVAALPVERQWAVMEAINASNPCHFFTACRKERAESTYRIDFRTTGFLDYVPSLRYRCEISGAQLCCPGWSQTLDHSELALLQAMDGRRTIGEIVAEASTGEWLAQMDVAVQREFAHDLFRSLWQRDVLAIGLGAGQGG